MTPRERILAVMRGQPVDRVPLVLNRFQRESRAQVDAIEELNRRAIAERVVGHVHFEVGVGASINRWLVTPPQRIRHERADLPNGRVRTTSSVDTPKGELTAATEWSPVTETSWTTKYPCESLDDIGKIASVPWELPAGLSAPDLGQLPDEFPTRGIVSTHISTPMVCVAGMMPYEMFLELSITHPARILELTETCRERVLDVLRVLFSKPGIEYVWMGGSEWVTPPMASPALYDALVQEQERSIIDFCHQHGAVVHVHCHGNVRHALGRSIGRAADYTEPVEPPPDGDITMAEAKAMADGRITLGGNIEARVLCHGSEEDVELAVRAAFEGGKQRFVLAPTEGPSPTISDREYRNWMKMIGVWEELSPA